MFFKGSEIAPASWDLPKLKMTDDNILDPQAQVNGISIVMKGVLQSTFQEMLCSDDCQQVSDLEITCILLTYLSCLEKHIPCKGNTFS